MRSFRVVFSLIFIGVVLTSCNSVTPPPNEGFGTITGTVTYYEKIGMPTNAVLNLKILDVLRSTETKPMWIAEGNITPLTQVPIPFTIKYEKSDIDPDRAYAIQARILVNGEVLFKNSATYRVITQGNPTHDLNVVVKVVSNPPPPTPNTSTLNGIIVYQRKIDFLPNTIVDVKLVDMSQDDSSKSIIGEQTIANPAEWPIPFALKYNAKAINPDHTYVVEASITVGNSLHFINQAAYAVLTRGGLTHNVEVTIEPISIPSKTASVTGTVMYYQEIALTSEAVIVVELIDASSKNPASRTIGKQSMTHPGQVPVAFELKYDPLVIHPGHLYAIQARIMVDGQLRFKNTLPYAVITQGNPSTIEIVVDTVR
jgi:uncharacterized lipoprotein YbaY